MELPFPEEIYDLDTFTLEELDKKLETHEKIDEQNGKQIKKLIFLVKQELEERKVVENFGNFLMNNEYLDFNYDTLMKVVEETQEEKKYVEKPERIIGEGIKNDKNFVSIMPLPSTLEKPSTIIKMPGIDRNILKATKIIETPGNLSKLNDTKVTQFKMVIKKSSVGNYNYKEQDKKKKSAKVKTLKTLDIKSETKRDINRKYSQISRNNTRPKVKKSSVVKSLKDDSKQKTKLTKEKDTKKEIIDSKDQSSMQKESQAIATDNRNAEKVVENLVYNTDIKDSEDSEIRKEAIVHQKSNFETERYLIEENNIEVNEFVSEEICQKSQSSNNSLSKLNKSNDSTSKEGTHIKAMEINDSEEIENSFSSERKKYNEKSDPSIKMTIFTISKTDFRKDPLIIEESKAENSINSKCDSDFENEGESEQNNENSFSKFSKQFHESDVEEKEKTFPDIQSKGNISNNEKMPEKREIKLDSKKEIDKSEKEICDSKPKIKPLNQTVSNFKRKTFIKESEKKAKPSTSSNVRPKISTQTHSQKVKETIKLKSRYNELPSFMTDYSDIIPCFNAIFTGYHMSGNIEPMSYISETLKSFILHVEKVDEIENSLFSYYPENTNFTYNPLFNDPSTIQKLIFRTTIDLAIFIERQKLMIEKINGNLREKPENIQYFRVIKSRDEVYDIITRSFLRKPNWNELPHGLNLKVSWNILWTWSRPQIDMSRTLIWQMVNHIPGNRSIVRKDLLKRSIERAVKMNTRCAAIMNFIPKSFILPKDYVQFMEAFYKEEQQSGDYNMWIMKPCGKSRGRGIFLVNKMEQVVYTEQMVIQKYIRNPLLLDGYKFDMRIYVLVTSVNPLEVFLYKEGFARVTTVVYDNDPEKLRNEFIHLTNVSVQKNSKISSVEPIFGGTKLSLKMLRGKLLERGISFDLIWKQVSEIIVKSLLAAQSEMISTPNTFELFGYDIMIDDNLKCWLLEVNSSPSLAKETILDDFIKQNLVDDIIDLISPPKFNRMRLIEVLERRFKEEQGCKSSINTKNNSKLQLNKDINYILEGAPIRRYGEMPTKIGHFQRIAPGEMYESLSNLIKR